MELTTVLRELKDSKDTLFYKVPVSVDKEGNVEADEDGKPLLTICAYCPAADWIVTRAPNGAFHLGYYCSAHAAEFSGRDMIYLDACDGFFKAVAEQKRLNELDDERRG